MAPVSAEEADEYYTSRTRDSQISAWASDQSRPLDRRETIEQRIAEVRAQFGEDEVTRPPHWSGFRLVPERIEFWEDGAYRLHHRRLFTRRPDGGWDQGLLYP